MALKPETLIGKHVHFDIPQAGDKPAIRGSGVIVYYIAPNVPLPEAFARLYYSITLSATPDDVKVRQAAKEVGRMVVLNQFGEHRVVAEGSWSYMKLG